VKNRSQLTTWAGRAMTGDDGDRVARAAIEAVLRGVPLVTFCDTLDEAGCVAEAIE
jgi:hypothetical protein